MFRRQAQATQCGACNTVVSEECAAGNPGGPPAALFAACRMVGRQAAYLTVRVQLYGALS
jgi:hypothetical protein